MDILFAGTPKASAKILKYLAAHNDINVIGVITQPDKPQKRGKKVFCSEVSAEAKSFNIPTYKPNDLDNNDIKNLIGSLNFDFLVVAAYGKILPDWLLNLPEHMPINIHYSLLPQYRGASPIQSSLLNGDKVSGVTFMEMSSGLDEGKIIDKYEININQDSNKSLLEEELSELAISKIYEVISNVYSNKYSSNQQEESLATYCTKIKKADSILNFSSPAEAILNKFRAYYSWPGVRFVHKKTMVKISKMHITEEKFDGSVGSIVRFDKSGLYIKTSTKTIVITYLQMPNKNVISSADAFNAYKQFFC